MFIHILANVGGGLLRTLERVVTNSGYYLSDEIDENVSFVIGFVNSFPEEIPEEKRIYIATPEVKNKSRGANVFCSSRFRSVKKIQGKYQTLEAFLSEKKKLIPLTVSC